MQSSPTLFLSWTYFQLWHHFYIKHAVRAYESRQKGGFWLVLISHNRHWDIVLTVILGVVSVFSLIVMSLSAHLIDYGSGKASIILALVVSILSLLSFPIMLVYFIEIIEWTSLVILRSLITDDKRKGFFTFKIQFELFWTGEIDSVHGTLTVFNANALRALRYSLACKCSLHLW